MKALVTTFKKKHRGKKTQEEKTTKMPEQIVLLQSFCEKITQEVELPAQAIAGLGDLLISRADKSEAAF